MKPTPLTPGTVYVLKFSQTIGNPSNKKGYANFYVGYAEPGRLDERIAEHRAGRGAKITSYAVQVGITFEVVATLNGDRWTERAVKNRGNTPKFVEQLLAGRLNLTRLQASAARVKQQVTAKWSVA